MPSRHTPLLIALVACACAGPASTTSTSTSGSSGQPGDGCADNRTDGASPASTAIPFSLGDEVRGTACSAMPPEYFYWVATGNFLESDRFVVELRLEGTGSADALQLYVDSGEGTYLHSDTAATVARGGTEVTTTRDVRPFEPGSDLTRLYVLAHAGGAERGTQVGFTFRVTRQIPDT